MTAAATRHAEQARRIGVFVHQTMRDRGMSCLRNELDAALLELTTAQLQQVHASATALSKGADTREDMSLLAALRTACAHATRTALSGANAVYRADVLLALASAADTAPVFTRELARLRRADLPETDRQQAGAQLRALCGPLDHADLLHEPRSTESASPAGSADLPAAAEDNLPETPVRPWPEGQASARRSAPSRRARQQVKVYGKAAALTCEAAPVRPHASGDDAAQWTVMIEGAKAAGEGTFGWATKMVFACAQRELPQLLAVLLGWQDIAEFKFHGGKANKSMLLQHQDHGLFVKLREAERTVAVPVTDPDRYALAMLALNVMAANDPSGSVQAVLTVCRDVMRPASFGTSPAAGAAQSIA